MRTGEHGAIWGVGALARLARCEVAPIDLLPDHAGSKGALCPGNPSMESTRELSSTASEVGPRTHQRRVSAPASAGRFAWRLVRLAPGDTARGAGRRDVIGREPT